MYFRAGINYILATLEGNIVKTFLQHSVLAAEQLYAMYNDETNLVYISFFRTALTNAQSKQGF